MTKKFHCVRDGEVDEKDTFIAEDGGGRIHCGCGALVLTETSAAQRESWDDFFMKMAALMATRSKDPSAKVGAVIVDYNHRVVGTGYNGFPRGVRDLPERYAEKRVKYSMVCHAEENAILNAIVKISDVTLYTTMFPCSTCTKSIIQSGINRVVCPEPRTEGIWAEDAEFSKQMLREALVFVYGPNASWQLHNDTSHSGRRL